MNDIDIEGPTFPETEPEIGWRQFAKNWMDTAMSYSEGLVAMSGEVAALRERLSILEDPGTPEAIVGAMFDAAQRLGHSPVSSKHALTFLLERIETGRQWETIARRLADAVEALLEPDDGQPEGMDLHGNLVYAHPEWEAKNALAAFRDLANRTPTPRVDCPSCYGRPTSLCPDCGTTADRTPTPTDGL